MVHRGFLPDGRTRLVTCPRCLGEGQVAKPAEPPSCFVPATGLKSEMVAALNMAGLERDFIRFNTADTEPGDDVELVGVFV